MNNITLLDCTLRDGGYYTNWDFDSELVSTYFESLNKLPIVWVEIGYRSKPQKEYLGEFFYCPDFVLKNVRNRFNGKIAVMLNEKDVQPEYLDELLSSAIGLVDMVRLAIDPKNIARAIVLGKEIKKMGFQIGFNVMYMSDWKNQPEFLDILPNINDVADYFYMVDSYGGIYPEEVKDILQIVKQRVSIPIGFHGHNNMELALINSLAALENGATLIDATITGMGRGAGNLKMELLLTALHAKSSIDLDFNALSDITHVFEQLQQKYQWGTNLPYMVSGANSLPQKDVMDWVGKRFYSYNSIIRALHNQKNKVDDNDKFEALDKRISHDEVLIIGGGPSVIGHSKAVKTFLEKNPNMALIHASAKNAKEFKGFRNNQYFCLVGIEGNRLEKILNDFGDINGFCLLPSYPRKMGTYVPNKVKGITRELSEASFVNSPKDAHTTLALQSALQMKASKIYIIGYDGYSKAILSPRELELFNENESIFAAFKRTTKLNLLSLTPTLYQELFSDSIYTKL